MDRTDMISKGHQPSAFSFQHSALSTQHSAFGTGYPEPRTQNPEPYAGFRTRHSAPSTRPKVVFMGSGAFAVPSLEALAGEGYHLVGVITQPPRPAGRNRKITPPPTMVAAERLGLPVLCPERVRAPEAVEQLKGLQPDLMVVAAYGQILPQTVLDIPTKGCINVHGSLLPRWRGAAPIQASLLAGDEFTGVSLMLMEAGLDTGPIIAQSLTRIEDVDEAPELEIRLSRSGAALLIATLPFYLDGSIKPVIQDPDQATYAPMIKKGDGAIDWSLPARQIWRANRAYRPWPGTFTRWKGKLLKVVSCWPEDTLLVMEKPGTVVALGAGKEIGVATGRGVLVLKELALEGGKTLGVRQFLAGHRDFVGSCLE
ncbi:MAG: methionyl-tRNA formyltransferase [Chloroflexota bacterium]